MAGIIHARSPDTQEALTPSFVLTMQLTQDRVQNGTSFTDVGELPGLLKEAILTSTTLHSRVVELKMEVQNCTTRRLQWN